MSVKSEVIEMAQSGVPPGEIAMKLNRMPNTVYSILCLARRDGVAIPKCRTGPSFRSADFIAVDRKITRKLAPHALSREIDTKALAAKILKVVIEGDLIDAVLDDEVRPDA